MAWTGNGSSISRDLTVENGQDLDSVFGIKNEPESSGRTSTNDG